MKFENSMNSSLVFVQQKMEATCFLPPCWNPVFPKEN